MIRRLAGATVLGAALAAGCTSVAPETGSARLPGGDGLSARIFRFTYTVRTPTPPAGARRLDLWVPLPFTDPGVQEVSALRIRTSPAGYRVTTDPDYGNRMVYLGVENPKQPVEVSWEAVITRYEDRGQGTLPVRPRYLAALRLVPITGKARELAEKLGLTDPRIPLAQRMERLAEDVVVNMEYDKSVPGYGLGDFERAVTVCRGNCTDFHARFMGAARAAGIPVRFTMGVPLKPALQGTYRSYHCWAHWYDGRRWLPVDLSEADKLEERDPEKARRYFHWLDPHRVAITVGRDLTLSPPQQGEPLNYFVFPYAEVDGRPWPLPKESWLFRWENVQPAP